MEAGQVSEPLSFEVEELPNQQWVDQIKASYVPIKISDKLYIGERGGTAYIHLHAHELSHSSFPLKSAVPDAPRSPSSPLYAP